MPESSPSSRWSGEAKAWLVFWLVLIIATPLMLLLFPEWFIWQLPKGRGRRLPTLKELPTVALILVWLGGGTGWFMWFRNQRRSLGLAAVAGELGLALTPAPEAADWDEMGVFAFFRIGFERSGRNWMTGDLGRYDIAILDYHFRRSGLPKDVEIQMSSRQYHQTVVAFWQVSERLPRFQLVSRESWWSHFGKNNRSPKGCITDLKIGKDLNADFFKHYLVGGVDEAQVREFFTPLLLEYFCANKGWDIESTDGHLLIYQEKKLQPPGKMAEFLEQAQRIAQTLQERAEEVGRR